MWLKALWDVLSVRSGRWRVVRARHLEREARCQACLRDKDLEVHHVYPVHAGGPELDAKNLLTLCRDCHFAVGHACDWKAWRPNVREVCETLRKSIER